MRRRNNLNIAQNLLRKRKFSDAITLLESRRDIYRDNFSYYLTLGIAYLYIGDIGNARSYFQRASSIDDSDVNLLLGQAVIYLRSGETDKALAYYLDVIDNDPTNPVAKNAMSFIQKNSDFETISTWVDDGRIEQFYPPLGINPNVLCAGAILGFLMAAALLSIIIVPRAVRSASSKNAHKLYQVVGFEKFELSKEEIEESKTAAENDGKPDDYYENLYNSIAKYLQMADNKKISDNRAQVEYNRLMLDSAAPENIKKKAELMKDEFREPSFSEFLKGGYKNYKTFAEKMHDVENAEDNFSIEQVIEGGALYKDCWVVWGGRLSAISVQEDDAGHSKVQFILHVGEYSNEFVSRDAYVTCAEKIRADQIQDDFIIVLAKITGFNARGEPILEATRINQQPLK